MQFSSFLWKDVKDRRKRRESFCSLLTIIITELKFNSKWSLTFRWRTTQPWAASFTIHCCWRNTFWKFANWWVMGIQMLKTSTKVWQKVPNWSGEAIADHPMVGFAFTSHTSGHDFLSSLCTITKKNKKFKKIFWRQKERRIFSLLPVLTSTLSEGSVDPNFLPLCLSLSERGKLGKLYFCWREIQTLTPVTSYFNTW